MQLRSLSLIGFRNYLAKDYSFDASITILVGNNGAGKTNILEAISLISTGDSYRANKIEELVHWEAEVAHIIGSVSTNKEKDELQITMTRGIVQGKRTSKRLYKINGVGKHKRDFAGLLLTVLFEPNDLQILTGSPSRRRRFLDRVLSQVDRNYRSNLNVYEQSLKRRNKILEAIREGHATLQSLTYWNESIVKNGQLIQQTRRNYLEFCNSLVWETQNTKLTQEGIQLNYHPSLISNKRLEYYARQEVIVGHTLVGPHKDDFTVFSQEDRDLALYGSRGEQRMAALWLKLAELSYIEQRTGIRPLLLLDDIFSELDDHHDTVVMRLLNKQQTIITATEISPKLAHLKGVSVLEIKDLSVQNK